MSPVDSYFKEHWSFLNKTVWKFSLDWISYSYFWGVTVSFIFKDGFPLNTYRIDKVNESFYPGVESREYSNLKV